MPEPHPENVAGDFYVEFGCCTSCDVPLIEAPSLFTYSQDADGFMHCYVSKQPGDEHELDNMLQAIRCAELKCIRYRGEDPRVLRRLTDMGESDVSDVLSRESVRPRRWWEVWRRCAGGERPV